MPSQPETDLPETTDWSHRAAIILRANLINLGKKVDQGEALTAAEVSILEAEAGGASQKKHPAHKSKLAKNKSQLADILGVSRKTIQRYTDRSDLPEDCKPKPNGSLNIEAWRSFLEDNEAIDDLDKSSLQAKQILLQNKILQQKIDLNDKILVRQEEVEKDVNDMIATAKAVLLAGPSSLAPQVVGVSVQEAETLLRQWLHKALSKLQEDPLGRGQEVSNA